MNQYELTWINMNKHEVIFDNMNSWLDSYSCEFLTRLMHDTYESVMSHVIQACHVWMCHVTGLLRERDRTQLVMFHVIQSCHADDEECDMMRICDMTRSNGRDSFISVTHMHSVQSTRHVCLTHSYVWRGSFICVTYLLHVRDMMCSYVWHNSFAGVTWLNHMCDMTQSYVYDAYYWVMSHKWMSERDASTFAPWCVHTFHTTHSHVWYEWFMCVCTCLIHMLDITRSNVFNISFISVTRLIHTFDMTRSDMLWGGFG